VIYGGCDAETAEFYSKASGTAIADDINSHLRHHAAGGQQHRVRTVCRGGARGAG